MRALHRLGKRIASLVGRDKSEQRLAAEIEEHLAQQTAENIRIGLSPEEARRQAILKFGGIEAVREAWREQRSLLLFETLFSDTRLTLRRLRKAPGFTTTAILTLALGIGATTSIFTLVYAVLIESLPVPRPAELVRAGKDPDCCLIGGFSQDKEFVLFSYDLYRYLKSHVNGFSDLAAFQAGGQTFAVRRMHGNEPVRLLSGEYVSGNYFRMFGIHAAAGRLLSPNDDQSNTAPVAVISDHLFRERYGSDPTIIGSVLAVNQKAVTIAGVAPRAFFGDTLRPFEPDLFLPLHSEAHLDPEANLNKANLHWLQLIGRIQPGGSVGMAQAQMRVALKEWLRSHWTEMSANDRANFTRQTLNLAPGDAGIVMMRQNYGHWLHILLAITALVLAIACANIANLMLARSIENRRQLSLSMALGARASRLMAQALTESIVISLMGGAAGLALGYLGTSLLLRFAFPVMAGSAAIPIQVSPSFAVLAFALAATLLAGLAFGAAPAYLATRVDPIEALRGAGRSTTRAGSTPRRVFVVLQAALSLILLSITGLLIASLHRLENSDFGFQTDYRLIAGIDPSLAGYKPGHLTALYTRIHDSLASIPGVKEVALAMYAPLTDSARETGVWVNAHPAPGPNDNYFASFARVTPGYLPLLGTPLLAGRYLSKQDSARSFHVAVINEAFALKFFPGENPIGKYFGPRATASHLYEVAGIVKNSLYSNDDIGAVVSPMFFLPEAQHDFISPGAPEINISTHYLRDIVLLTQPGAHITQAQIRRAITAIDPNLPVTAVRTLGDQVSGAFHDQRLLARLTSLFGLLSLVLASIGLYGLTAYNVTQRTSEIGVRMALGAGRSEILAVVVRDALRLIVIGILVGLPLSFAAGKLLGAQLYGTDPFNPVVVSIAIAALALSAAIAALAPALRASSIAPLEALRTE